MVAYTLFIAEEGSLFYFHFSPILQARHSFLPRKQ